MEAIKTTKKLANSADDPLARFNFNFFAFPVFCTTLYPIVINPKNNPPATINK